MGLIFFCANQKAERTEFASDKYGGVCQLHILAKINWLWIFSVHGSFMKHTRAWQQCQVFRMKQTDEKSEIRHKVLLKTKQIGYWKASKPKGRIFGQISNVYLAQTRLKRKKGHRWRALLWFLNQLWFVILRTSDNVAKI